MTDQIPVVLNLLAGLTEHAADWHRELSGRPNAGDHNSRIRGTGSQYATPPPGMQWTAGRYNLAIAADPDVRRRWNHALDHLRKAHLLLGIDEPAPQGDHPRVLVRLCDQIAGRLRLAVAVDEAVVVAIREATNSTRGLHPTPNWTPCKDPRRRHTRRPRKPGDNPHGLCDRCLEWERHILNQPVWRTSWGCRTWLCPWPHKARDLCDTHYRTAKKAELKAEQGASA